ncbi:hypothetical protein GCM10007852_31280 [Agaribacter marinus]|uniref:DUF4405 domain-containing protein n=2 Tax=Agaribacter marinus TaxID=1431249 RepID=A0AA37T6D4_9ALTE|nr:hypothetical protein GCM10007852_31280 [Agaribacter marinus]
MVSTIHSLAGFSFIAFALWHVKNNLLALINHLRLRTAKRLNFELAVAFFGVATLISLSLIDFDPFKQFYAWGQSLRSSNTHNKQSYAYEVIDMTTQSADGTHFRLDFRTGSRFAWPQYAFWLETLDGKMIQPLFVTAKLANNHFANKVKLKNPNQSFSENPLDSQPWNAIFNDGWEPQTAATRARPESLPVFLHKLGIHPKQLSKLDIDGLTGATASNSFIYLGNSKQALPQNVKLKLEINQSFDFNEYYSSDRFPDDPVYSGNGFSGQPSLIYETTINSDSNRSIYVLELVGHGHHSGKTGELYKDLSKITTAKYIVDRIVVEVGK